MASVNKFLVDAFQNEYLNECLGNEGDVEFLEVSENELELLKKRKSKKTNRPPLFFVQKHIWANLKMD